MEKVKVTRKQADAIESLAHENKKADIVTHHIVGTWLNDVESLGELCVDDLVCALYIGYEVEPEFKAEVGDWIKDTSTGAVFQIRDMQHRNNIMDTRYTTKRYATELEIAQEKERGWWAKHGREPWELKQGDVISEIDGSFLVVQANTNISKGDAATPVKDGANKEIISSEYIREKCKVACFTKDRLDVSVSE